MKKRKIERKDQLFSVLDQLQRLLTEISRSLEDNLYKMVVEAETDLSLKRLEELHKQLLEYQDEKVLNRLKLIIDHMSMLHSLCFVLGMDFKHTIHEIHPTLDDLNGEKDITNNTIEGLANSVQILREVKIQRWQRVEAEVSKLEQLKSIKLKEILLKKKLEPEEVCRQSHMVTEILSAAEYSNEAIESGVRMVVGGGGLHLFRIGPLFGDEELRGGSRRIRMDELEVSCGPCMPVGQIELQIARAKEEALSRKEILEKIEKWLAAYQEES
ncbi:putative microtubule-associated protein, MAP65/Ase1/PRC1 [Rosa chinensis]|uniref:Putative microtubule-associated protein, MAP65/Ase1/PRC1 n=1 Tax=Rosa chinensis TaxID=74649 RepID=A0A2P6QUJ6_ROSCH|nr:putative microtubule-associated protein, MAP65/Ase1/PRC1 [Rosa chinensis]